MHGNIPFAGLIFDNSGNLYGTTFYGGAYGGRRIFDAGGTVFELIPQPGGSWTQELLHSFGNGTDASNPYGGLIFDPLAIFTARLLRAERSRREPCSN